MNSSNNFKLVSNLQFKQLEIKFLIRTNQNLKGYENKK
jgi:hypothetical protein